MSLLLIGIVVWLLLAVCVCSLGRAAAAGDRAGFGYRGVSSKGLRAAFDASADPHGGSTARPQSARVPASEDWFGRELLDARRALRSAEARVAQLEGRRRMGAA